MHGKNILIFSLTYYPFVGGAEVAWKEITDRIDTYEFDMVVAKMDSKLASYEKIGNIHVYRVGIGVKIFDKLLYCLLAPIKGYRLNRNRQYHTQIGLMASFGGFASAVFKILCKKVPYILNLQDGDTDEYINQKTKYIRPLYKKIFTSADIVTTIAYFLKQRALVFNPQVKVSIIPNGVDIEKFSLFKRDITKISTIRNKLALKKEDRVIITTSRLNYKNAIDDIIRSLEYLSDSYKFICLGEGEDRKKLEQLIIDKHLGNRVYLLGYVDHREMLDYLSVGDYFCRPSLQEGLGNSFLEAMAFGLPVVATPVGGIVDFLDDGVTGYFANVKDPQSIATAIKKIDGDREKTIQIISNAKKLVIDNYNWIGIAQKYTTLFQAL